MDDCAADVRESRNGVATYARRIGNQIMAKTSVMSFHLDWIGVPSPIGQLVASNGNTGA